MLEGGLATWIGGGRPLQTGYAGSHHAAISRPPEHGLVASRADVRAAVASGAAQLVDARPAARFRGEAPEPRPGLRRAICRAA